MKYRMFISILLLPMLSITSSISASGNIMTDAATSEPFTSRITLALEKFSVDFARADHTESQKAIDNTYNFYARMVLMHVRLEDYVESFLSDKLPWYHIVGLAFAFNDYKASATPAGFTEKNSVFLTEIFRLSCERKIRP